ncbi:MAG: aldehyde dehydrogenase family protein, partial [Pseudomonadota bacterium]
MTLIAQPTASHHVNGRYHEDSDGADLTTSYPATGDVIAKLHAATPAVVDAALTAADRARADWATMPGVERGRILRRAAEIIRSQNHALSVLET